MADSPSLSPTRRRPPTGFVRRCEQCCWTTVTHFPLVLVYGLTTWAVWVETSLSLKYAEQSMKGYLLLLIGIALYVLLNWSYTKSVFTDPGSPMHPPTANSSSRHQYSHLPTHEPFDMPDLPSLTVKSTGGTRFCKKCQARKPDRAHHCSTCRRCVLKMDHHCPWLATCVGFRNYKAFILFCAYTTLFCWVCFGVSLSFVMTEVMSDEWIRGGGAMLGINMVLLVVLSGIIGVVLAGFTGWHIHLASRNQTTIECLEKTRYSTPIKRTMQRAAHLTDGGENPGLMQRAGQQLASIHANAIPGVTRTEEGEERPSPNEGERLMTAQEALRMNYNDLERERERERYESYLEEKESEKLPNAFDLGWRRNLRTLFGEQPLLWFLPVSTTVGDGWHWEPNPKWLAAREAMRLAREDHWAEQERREAEMGWGNGGLDNRRHYIGEDTTNHSGMPSAGFERQPRSKADRVLGRQAGQYADEGFNQRPGSEMSMKTLRRHGGGDDDDEDTASIDGIYDNEDRYDVSSDEAGEGNTGQAWRRWG